MLLKCDIHRVIDVGMEWRVHSSENANADPSRVGERENALLEGTGLSTMIVPRTGSASFDERKVHNRLTVSQFFSTSGNHFFILGNFMIR